MTHEVGTPSSFWFMYVYNAQIKNAAHLAATKLFYFILFQHSAVSQVYL